MLQGCSVVRKVLLMQLCVAASFPGAGMPACMHLLLL